MEVADCPGARQDYDALMKPLLWTAAIICVMGCRETGMAGTSIGDEVMEALRVVEDPDGFTNIRSGPSVKSAVSGKAVSGSIVSITGLEGDWAKLASPTGKEKPAYIHSSRLRKLDSWKEVAGKQGKDESKASVKDGTVEVSVMSSPFVAADHRITKSKEGATVVDGIQILGVDGGLPQHSLTLTVTMDGKPVSIPVDATRDLFEPNHDSLILLTPPKTGGPFIVLMQNSDGAGSYTVAWAFAGGKYLDREILGAP